MKKILPLFFTTVCILLCLVFFSGCLYFLVKWNEANKDCTYKDMKFYHYSVVESSTEKFKPYKEYYVTGDLTDENIEVYFIPPYVKGIPVLQLGSQTDFMHGGRYISTPKLANLYIPSTILNIDRSYGVYVEEHDENFNAFYCGAVLDLAELVDYKIGDKCFVPAEKFDEFYNAWNSKSNYHHGSADDNLFKANVAYRLNAEDMADYYYIDYVEDGSNIVNIPPEPERSGYTFEGWYIEKECYTKWSFSSAPILTATDSNPDGEFNLYAKWTKK